MPERPASVSALGGLRVIELGAGVAPAFAGRWLAAFGATVVKVEPPDGGWMRRYSPTGELFAGETGPLAAYLDTGKQRVTLDLATPEGRATLRELVEAADAVIHDLEPSQCTRAGLDLGVKRDGYPRLVEVALTPFGPDGPYATYAATAIVLLALGGYQYLTGEPEREPLMLPGFQPEYLTGFYGLIAALAGIVARFAGDAGRRFEITAMEALASLHQFTTSQWLYEGSIRSRHGNRWENLYPITMLPCRDGYVALSMPTPDQWERLCHMIERSDLIGDPRFATPALRRANADALDAILAGWLHTRAMDEIFTTAQEQWRLPVNPYRALDDVLHDPQYAARGFWVRPDGDTTGILHPGMPVIMSETPWSIQSPRAAAASAIFAEPAHPSAPRPLPPALQIPTPVPHPRREAAAPLAGLRVLDFTRVWSGPLCTRILADLGAEVIKIEPPFPRNAPAAPADESPGMPARPVAGLGKLSRNKLSVGIDLRLPAGRDLLKRLAARSDVLVENFSARVMPNFGLGYPALREVNPALIYLAMSGYGTTGPYRDYLGYGSATEAMTGLTALLGYPGGEPLNSAIAYPDPVAGLAGAAAVLTALVHRARTGRGQFLDLSQLEPASMMLGEYFLAAQMSGREPPRIGNEHPVWAPHGTYRCRGEDAWVSLAVRSDEEWAVFCRVAGLDEIGADPAYATTAGRRAGRKRLDAAISAWTADKDKFAVMERLQRAGIPAGAVLNARELVEDPHLKSRGFFVEARSPEGGAYPMPGTPITIDGQKRQEWHAAPYRGEHNRTVLKGILGLDDAEIASLAGAGVLVSDPAAVP